MPARESTRTDRDGIVCRHLTVRSGTIDEATRSVEVILATENKAAVFDARSWSVIDEVLRMDGVELPQQVPMLADHDRFSIEAIRGSLRNFKIDGDKLIARAVFAEDEPSQRAWDLVRAGHLTDVSVGYQVSEYTDIEPNGRANVRGRDYTAGPRKLRISTRWHPHEGSLVPIGADPGAKFREAPADQTVTRANGPQEPAMPPKFRAWLESRGLNPDTLTEAQRTALAGDFAAIERAHAAPAAPATPPASPAAPAHAAESEAERAAVLAGERRERERTKRIRELGAGMDGALIARAVDEGWTVERAATEFLTVANAQRSAPVGAERLRVDVTAAGEDKFARAVEAECMMVAGYGHRADKEALALARDLRGMGLQDLARAALNAERRDIPVGLDELRKRAFSTISLPTALGTTVSRIVQAAYEETPSTILEWAIELDCKDFREHKSIKLGKFARPEKVGKGGELKHDSYSEEAEGYSVATYGKLFGVTRTDFINDDVGAFTIAPAEIGAAMRRNIDDIGYGTLISASGLGPTLDADSTALFDSSRSDGSNYLTGAGSTLQSSSLVTAEQTFLKVRQGGVILSIIPEVLLVPPALKYTAMELMNSSAIIVAGTTDTLRGNANVHAGSKRLVVEPRLELGANGVSATNGATAWYLVAGKRSAAKSLAVCYLRGQRNPTVERVDQSPEVLGFLWRAYHDVGVDAIDWRGIQRTKGAA